MAKDSKKDSLLTPAAYQNRVNPKLMLELKAGIIRKIEKQRKYLLNSYSVKDLAQDLGTNTRYVAATIARCFGMNFSMLKNFYRIKEAKRLLTDKTKLSLTIEQVGDMVGFSSRQSFYEAFKKFENLSPHQYRIKMINNG